MPIVDIYVRLSDEDRDKREGEESTSIQNQKSLLVRHCVEQGWDIYNIYSDEDYSGADRERPGWLQMIDDCEQGRVDTVLCKSMSRFSRDVEMIEKYIHGKFLEWNVRFVSLVDHADTSIKGNKKSRQINSLVNEWYLEDLSENIRRTLYHMQDKGLYTGSFAPYGYQLDPDCKNHLVIDPVAGEVVRLIYRLAEQGLGYVAIAKELNNRCIPNPSQYKKSIGSRFKTNHAGVVSQYWTPSTVYVILHNETYTGTLVQHKSQNLSYKSSKRKRIPKEDWKRSYNAHEALIDPELWQRIQERHGQSRQEKLSGTRHPLSGKVFCAECGSRMVKLSSRSMQASSSRYQYLRCKAHYSSDSLCTNARFIRLDLLEARVLEELNRLLDEYFDASLISPPKEEKRLNLKQTALIQEQKQLCSSIRKKEAGFTRLYEDRLEETISDDQFMLVKASFTEELERCRARLAAVEVQLEEAGQVTAESDYKALPCRYRRFDALTYEAADGFIDRILIGKLDENGCREIEIRWNF